MDIADIHGTEGLQIVLKRNEGSSIGLKENKDLSDFSCRRLEISISRMTLFTRSQTWWICEEEEWALQHNFFFFFLMDLEESQTCFLMLLLNACLNLPFK